MAKGLPGPSRAIDAIEAAGDLVEVELRLFAATSEDAFEVNLVAGVFGEFRAPRMAS